MSHYIYNYWALRELINVLENNNNINITMDDIKKMMQILCLMYTVSQSNALNLSIQLNKMIFINHLCIIMEFEIYCIQLLENNKIFMQDEFIQYVKNLFLSYANIIYISNVI